MPRASAVSVISLLCSVLQLVYIVSILWLLRVRSRRLRESTAKLPMPAHANERSQHTNTHTAFYEQFLPESFQSTNTQVKSAAPSTTIDPGFSYEAATSPLTVVTATASTGSRTSRGSDGSTSGGLHPDIGRMSFTASMVSASSSSGSSLSLRDRLYDDAENGGDPFAAPNEKPNGDSRIAPHHLGTFRATPYHQSILEGDESSAIDNSVTVSSPSRGHDVSSASERRSDLQVSLDGDDLTAQTLNVDVVVEKVPTASRHSSSIENGIQLETSRSGSRLSPSLEDGALHVSAAPFTVASSDMDTYNATAGDGATSRLLRSDPPRAQSRHIVHPKSMSFRSSELETGGGMLLGGSSLAHGIFGMMNNHQVNAAAKRMSRRMRIEAAARSLSGSSSGFLSNALGLGDKSDSLSPNSSMSATSSTVGMRIPARAGTPHSPAIDPNASPVRSRVKFADSPRDRAAAGIKLLEPTPMIAGSNSTIDISPDGNTAIDSNSALIVQSSNPAVDADSAVAASVGVVAPKPRKSSLLKHKNPLPPPAEPVSAVSGPLLILPIYYRFLILQCVHCFLWSLAALALLSFGTNLVEWGSDVGVNPSAAGSSKSWLFSVIMACLLGMHAGVNDGILIFLSAKNVGRASIRFSIGFAIVWGILNGVSILVVVQTVSDPAVPRSGLLPQWHPFFIRCATSLILNIFLLIAPNACVCHARARRGNSCRKSKEEKLAYFARQAAKWERAGYQFAPNSVATPPSFDSNDSEEDSFDEEEYDDDTQSRTTWLHLVAYNLFFQLLIFACYLLDFSNADSDDSLWESVVMALLGASFVLTTPIIYACLQKDSIYWSNEWKNSLSRMKVEAELDENLRKKQIEEAMAKAKAEGKQVDAAELNKRLTASRPNAYATFQENNAHNFFLDYSVLEYGGLLGSGGFSSVYSAKLWNQLDVAVKVLHIRDMSKEVIDQFLHEVGIVLQLNHPNVVHFLGVVFSPPDLVMVMERCRRQSLLHLIKHNKVKFTEYQAVSIGLAIADALRYIHELDILHRDLKAANILFDLAGRPKVCDFGLSEERSKIDLNRVFCGTLAYMGPEVLRSETVGKYSDVYSFSIILWELLHNELAWKRGSNQKNGLNARVLVEMVAYRRARPPVKERLVCDEKVNPHSDNFNGVGGGTSNTVQYAPDSARIHPKAFVETESAPQSNQNRATVAPASSSSSSSSSTSSTTRPGIHPFLVQLLRECWRDDYRRRPTFTEIVRRLTEFRQMVKG